MRHLYIHNRGIANDIYIHKAKSHLRVTSGTKLPVNIFYFLESYEACLQMTEWFGNELHKKWYSSDFDDRKKQQMELPLQEQDTK